MQAVEQAVLEYHRVRRETADCLRFIFEAADSAQRGFVVNTRIRLNEFAKRYLVDGGGEGSLAARVFTELENLGGAIADARVAVTNAVSNTRLPNTQGHSNCLTIEYKLTVKLQEIMQATLDKAF